MLSGGWGENGTIAHVTAFPERLAKQLGDGGGIGELRGGISRAVLDFSLFGWGEIVLGRQRFLQRCKRFLDRLTLIGGQGVGEGDEVFENGYAGPIISPIYITKSRKVEGQTGARETSMKSERRVAFKQMTRWPLAI